MQPKHLSATLTLLLTIALLAGCATPAAAPTATPVPPTATPVPPTPAPVPPTAITSLLDLAKTYESAWNSYEPDALAALFAESFTFNGSPIKDFTAWHRGWPYGMMMGSGGKIQVRDCEVSNDTVTCTIVYDSDCNDQEMIETWTVKDGKITELVWQVTPEEASKWDRYESLLTSWATAQNPAELSAYKAETAKGLYDFEWGGAFSALCHRYEEAAKVQAPATAAAAQALVEAINSNDLDAALALLTDDAKFQVWEDKAEGADQLRSLFDRLAGKETQYQVTDCEWQGFGVECKLTVVDGCIAVSGVSDGIPGKMRFYSLEDGTLRQISGSLTAAQRKEYEAWLKAENAWASANRGDELAQAEGYSQEAGAMAVKLCQEYAAAQAEGTSGTADAQSGLPAVESIPIIWDDDGSIDGVTALLYLLQNPAFEVKAATISPGIAHAGVFAPNLARFFALLGVEGIPIAAGPEEPLAGDNAFPAAWRTASDKFWDLELPDAAGPIDEKTAAELIVDVVKNSEEPVTIFVSGSLTNLAQALRLDPSIKDGIRSVEIMGGAVEVPGNVGTVPAEWNIYIDPVAASEVFASGLELHLTPLDATDQVPWAEADATDWESSNTPAGSTAAQFLRRTLQDWSSQEILIWDLVAALNAANRDLCEWQDLHLEVVTDDAAKEGQTVVVDGQPANVSVCLSPDVDAYQDAAQEVFGKVP